MFKQVHVFWPGENLCFNAMDQDFNLFFIFFICLIENIDFQVF